MIESQEIDFLGKVKLLMRRLGQKNATNPDVLLDNFTLINIIAEEAEASPFFAEIVINGFYRRQDQVVLTQPTARQAVQMISSAIFISIIKAPHVATEAEPATKIAIVCRSFPTLRKYLRIYKEIRDEQDI